MLDRVLSPGRSELPAARGVAAVDSGASIDIMARGSNAVLLLPVECLAVPARTRVSSRRSWSCLKELPWT
jgi:hypothetical protein